MSRAGFSLIELLVVVAVLATVAGGVVVSLSGVETHAATELTVRELAELKQAVLRFREDTGFLPKQGPFALEPAGQVPEPSAGVAWFASPANLSQLIENPLRTRSKTGCPRSARRSGDTACRSRSTNPRLSCRSGRLPSGTKRRRLRMPQA